MPPLRKAAVFIDNGYLKEILKKSFNGNKIDYADFADELCKDNCCTRGFCYVYDGASYQSRNPTSDERKNQARQRKFIDKISKLERFKLVLGRQLPNYGENGRIISYRQKGVDVRLALDMVDLSRCAGSDIEAIILISGDADFEPAAIRIKQEGHVRMIVGHNSNRDIDSKNDHSRYLVAACSEEYEIAQGLILRCSSDDRD